MNAKEMSREQRLLTAALYYLYRLKEKGVIYGDIRIGNGEDAANEIAASEEFSACEIEYAADVLIKHAGGLEIG